MNEFEFAQRYMGEFTVKGDEIIPTLCPYCHGGSHGDKYTFALNTVNHTFNCKRGSCGKQGHFSQLLKDFGEDFDMPKVKRSYTRPKPLVCVDNDVVGKYVTLRGIKPLTAELYGLTGNSQNEVVFPFYETEEDFKKNEPVFIKYRPARKIKKGENKARREKGAMPILYGMHLCKPHETLYLFEGEFDSMAGYQATGYNCVSLPSGCSDFTWLDNCEEWLKDYDTIAIIADNDEAGHKVIQRMLDKTSFNILVPDFELYGGCKDTNEILYKYGESRVKEVLDSVKPLPVEGLLNIADVKQVDPSEMPRTLTGIPTLDRMMGGMYDGDLNVWTGKRGEGKTTFVNEITLGTIDQDRNVCVYSGEIPASRYKYNLYLQAATSFHVCEYMDKAAGRTNYYVPESKVAKMDKWLDGRYWLYDNKQMGANEVENVLKVFEKAYKCYDCTVFVVDNLMTLRLAEKNADYYRQQSIVAQQFKDFAVRFDVCVHLIAHPRKTNGREILDNDDIGGSGDISNIACNTFSIQRLSDDDKHENGCDAVLNVMKNRLHGKLGAVKLNFSEKCKQLWETGTDEHKFGWENIGNASDDDEPLPF